MIQLKDFSGKTILGLYEKEREDLQGYLCEVGASYRVLHNDFISDYALLEGVIRFIIENGSFYTIEEILDSLGWFFSYSLLSDLRLIKEMNIRISKPEILDSGTVPSVANKFPCAYLPLTNNMQLHQSSKAGTIFKIIQMNTEDIINLGHYSKDRALILEGDLLWGEQLFKAGDCVFTREKESQVMQVPKGKSCVLLQINFNEAQDGFSSHPKEQYF